MASFEMHNNPGASYTCDALRVLRDGWRRLSRPKTQAAADVFDLRAVAHSLGTPVSHTCLVERDPLAISFPTKLCVLNR